MEQQAPEDTPTPRVDEAELPEAVKSRIRLEELFRQSLKKPASNWERFSGFLNSSFGLWLLTLLIITLGGGKYQEWQYQQKQKRDNDELRRKLEVEISYRVKNAYEVATSTTVASSIDHYKRKVLDALDSAPALSMNRSIYPEYSERGFKSLLAELASLSGPSVQAIITAGESTYDKLASQAAPATMYNVMGIDDPQMAKKPVPSKVRDQTASLLQVRLISPRWHRRIVETSRADGKLKPRSPSPPRGSAREMR